MDHRAAIFASCLTFLVGTHPAFAVDAPALPNDAKRLCSAQISELYAGLTITFKTYTFDKLVTGRATYNANMKRLNGTYKMGREEGTFSNPIRVTEDDLFCHKEGNNGPETCSRVYVQRNAQGKVSKIWETTKRKTVQSQSTPEALRVTGDCD